MRHCLAAAVDAETFVLGSLVQVPDLMVQAAKLQPGDFSLESHRRIWNAMVEVYGRGERIEAMTVRTELDRRGELESVGGIDYLVHMDDGIPIIPNIEGYVRIVLDAAALRNIAITADHLKNRAMSGMETADEILSAAKESFLAMAIARKESTLLSPGAIIAEGGGLTQYLDRRGGVRGVSTGYTRLDMMTGGMRPGSFWVIGARPSMGKTALMLNVVDFASVKREQSSLIFSLEMDRQSILDRMICARARVNSKRFEGGYLNAEEMRRAMSAAGEIDAGRVLIDDKATTDMREIHAKIRKEQARGPVDLVVIDYLQLMIGGDVKSRVSEASRISRDMKLVAKDCGVPVVALSQLNRECDSRTDHRPMLSDLRETGAIEQDADVVVFLFRPEVYDRTREDLRGRAELIVAKQRTGPIGTVNLTWLGEVVRFENSAEESEGYDG